MSCWTWVGGWVGGWVVGRTDLCDDLVSEADAD